jgi:hypothetical protein
VVAPPIRTAAITANEDFFNGIGQQPNQGGGVPEGRLSIY